MAHMKLPDLSKAEYEILRVLWKSGQSSVREVHDHLQKIQGWAYTTTKTMMDRMVQKGLLQRDSFHGVFLYRPLISRPQGLAHLIEFFADRVLELDSATVLSLFQDSKAITPEEIKELERILHKEKGGKR